MEWMYWTYPGEISSRPDPFMRFRPSIFQEALMWRTPHGSEERRRWRRLPWEGSTPVSYTHLDVYKRQPLGNPSEFVHDDLEEVKNRKYLFVAGGVGTAPVYPQVKWLKEHGVSVDVIMGSKTKDLLILEDEMRTVAGNLYVTTDDGSYERKGMVTEVIKDLVVNQGKKYDVCVAIGPMIMMKFTCLMTKEPVSYTHLLPVHSGTYWRRPQ